MIFKTFSLQRKKLKFVIFVEGRRQNLKEVPQNFTEVFNVDDVTANNKKTNVTEKKINLSSIVITDIKLAS